MKQLPTGYTVYCDESRHDGADKNPYMAIGGMWVPTDKKQDLTRELRQLLRGLGVGSEFKWSKTSHQKTEAYQALVDFFFTHDLNFRVIVVEQGKLDYPRFKEGDDELGFYTFYYEMLIKWLEKPGVYNLLLDFKKNKGTSHYDDLARCLRRKIPLGTTISGVHVIDSADSPLAQLNDLLTGAVAASWCGFPGETPKSKLADYIAIQAKKPNLREISPTPVFEKFNIFKIVLR